MANSTVPNLPPAGELTGSELLHIVQEGNSRRTSLGELSILAAGLTGARNWSVPWRGAVVRREAAYTVPSWPWFYPWDAPSLDTDGFWSVAQTSRLTIPNGVKKVRLSALGVIGSGATATGYFAEILKNESETVGKTSVRQGSSGYSDNLLAVVTPIFEVEPGDFFELRINVGSTSSGLRNVPENSGSWFCLEVVEADDVVFLPYDDRVVFLGTAEASATVGLDVATRAYRIAENAEGSRFYADAAPVGGPVVFEVTKNGTPVGAITFPDGSNTGLYSGSVVEFAPGDVRKITAPGTTEGIADLSFNFKLEAL